MNMMFAKRKVKVMQVPAATGGKEEKMLLREVENYVQVDRPRIVLDCSNLRQLDKTAAQLLLRCLEEAMKRNGDVRLACLPVGAESLMEATGLNRIFDTYGTVVEAENSFYEIPKEIAQSGTVGVRSPQESESAA